LATPRFVQKNHHFRSPDESPRRLSGHRSFKTNAAAYWLSQNYFSPASPDTLPDRPAQNPPASPKFPHFNTHHNPKSPDPNP